jgi:ABC-type bacteriocin/lantibiotic exporter with double-glycine peptidase domain
MQNGRAGNRVMSARTMVPTMKTIVFPELRQVFCFDGGACSLASVLAYYGVAVREDEIMQLARTSKGGGTTPAGIVHVLRYFGLEPIAGCLSVDALHTALDRCEPVILALQVYRSDTSRSYNACWNDGHYVVAIGYDAQRVYVEDPSSYKRTWLTFEELSDRWHDTGVHGRRLINWGCIVRGRPDYRHGDAEHME